MALAELSTPVKNPNKALRLPMFPVPYRIPNIEPRIWSLGMVSTAVSVNGTKRASSGMDDRPESRATAGEGKGRPAMANVMVEDKQRLQALERTLGQIEKSFGKGSIMRLDSDAPHQINGISTGALSLDIALGGKGVPRGRVVEIFGPESSGKTTLALTIIAQAQKAGGVAAFIDAEHALDPSWA